MRDTQSRVRDTQRGTEKGGRWRDNETETDRNNILPRYLILSKWLCLSSQLCCCCSFRLVELSCVMDFSSCSYFSLYRALEPSSYCPSHSACVDSICTWKPITYTEHKKTRVLDQVVCEPGANLAVFCQSKELSTVSDG